MHYYLFHIGDYAAHTGHLDHLEDLAYRRMLDWCYLHERPLPDDVQQISRLIRMPTHCDSIANVLREFFEQDAGWWQTRIGKELSTVAEKSQKAAASAKARWDKDKSHANALPAQCERNATQDPRPNTQDPEKKSPEKRASRLPSDFVLTPEMVAFCKKERADLDPEKTFATFRDHWTAKAGKDGAKLDWLATWRNWVRQERSQVAGFQRGTYDVAKMTTPAHIGLDPTLIKMNTERQYLGPPNPEIAARIKLALAR